MSTATVSDSAVRSSASSADDLRSFGSYVIDCLEDILALGRLSLCRCTDQTRFQLSGIHISSPHWASGAVACATDGKTLAAYQLEASRIPEAIIIPPEICARLQKNSKAKHPAMPCSLAIPPRSNAGVPRRVCLTLGSEMISAFEVEGAFPEYSCAMKQIRDVEGTGMPDKPYAIDPYYIERARAVAGSAGTLTSASFRGTSHDMPAWFIDGRMAVAVMPLVGTRDTEEPGEGWAMWRASAKQMR